MTYEELKETMVNEETVYEVTYLDEDGDRHDVLVHGEEEVREVINRPNMCYQVFMNVTDLF